MSDSFDEVIQYNRERWNALVDANVSFSRPFFDLDIESARAAVDPQGKLGEVAGKEVLCLAASGGQQSAALAMLGARVTVFDLADRQLARDRETAERYGYSIRTVQGDMRDLSVFADSSFDAVWHAYSINFVPEVVPVLHEVARIIRPDGRYRMEWANPFVGALDESEWAGDGYRLHRPYVDGGETTFSDTSWEIDDDGETVRVEGPREFRHTLSTVVNTLTERGFILQGIWESITGDPDAEPGSWPHLQYLAPPWLTLWARYRPDLMAILK